MCAGNGLRVAPSRLPAYLPAYLSLDVFGARMGVATSRKAVLRVAFRQDQNFTCVERERRGEGAGRDEEREGEIGGRLEGKEGVGESRRRPEVKERDCEEAKEQSEVKWRKTIERDVIRGAWRLEEKDGVGET